MKSAVRAFRNRNGSVFLFALLGMVCALVAVAPSQSDHSALAATSCPNGTGYGGQVTSSDSDGLTQGGHGCLIIVHSGGADVLVHTGAIQNWTVPAGITSITLHLIGAGGGAGLRDRGGSRGGNGGGGGYAMGTLAVTPGTIYDVIVGGAGRYMCTSDAPQNLSLEQRRNYSFGGGAAGYGGSAWDCSWASGGGRTALRTSGGADDIITAGGGGGGGYWDGHGGAGGGTSGQDGASDSNGTGGTQSAGGLGGVGEDGYPGVQYAGGPAGINTDTASEGGGGGGGYFGGGGAGNNSGGGGGSSYVATARGLQSGSTQGGNGRTPGAVPPTNSGAPTISGTALVGNVLTASTGTWSGATSTSFKWQSSSDGTTWTDIDGASGASYTVGVSGFIRVVETAANYFGVLSANSTSTTAIVDTTLANLVLSHGTLSPSFSSGVFSYTATVPYTRTSITVTPTRRHSSSTLTVNGVAVNSGTASGTISLAVGANTITVVVTNTGVSATTTISMTRQAATVPGAPSITSVTGGDRKLTVEFTAPASDGGEEITDYEYALNGAATWRSADSITSPIVIDDLNASTTYSVRLRAVNSVGAGAGSTSTDGTTSTPITTTAPTTTTTATTVAVPAATSGGQTVPTNSGMATMSTLPQSFIAAPMTTVPIKKESTETATTTTSSTTSTTTSTTVPQSLEVGEKSATIVVNGQALPFSINRASGVVMARSGSFEVSLAAVDEVGAVIPFDVSGNVRMQIGESVRVTAKGFASTTPVDVWLFSDPLKLGSTIVENNGAFEESHKIPDGVSNGSHTVLMTGTSSAGDDVQIAISIMVGDPQGFEEAGRVALIVILVLAVGGAIFLPAALKRRRDDEEENQSVHAL